MPFEWDERKRGSNLAKHGIDFVRPVLERPDSRGPYSESRWIAVGHWDGFYMVVIYTWRGGSRRIISAWKAGRHEREAYDNRIGG
ncbi:MAG: BrnT family toxin [Alphaproteobacteria bacterium]